jgi:uncharacterized protein
MMSLSEFAERFAPMQDLALYLLDALPKHDDGAHDLGHLARVWTTVRMIQAEEGGSLEVLLAATLLHDAVPVAKDSPERALASRRAASHAIELLGALGWPEAPIRNVAHAVAAHSISAGIAPETLEACILRDADRMDAIGAVGIARCFYTGGRLGQFLYNLADPRAERRELDDGRFTIDHFLSRLLFVAESMMTSTGRNLAAERHARLKRFVEDFLCEANGNGVAR